MNQPRYIIRPHGKRWFLIELDVRVVVELNTVEACERVRGYLEHGPPPADDPRWHALCEKMLDEIARGVGR